MRMAVKKLNCSICKKPVSFNHLKQHVKTHQGKSLVCEFCFYATNSLLKFEKHIFIHTDEYKIKKEQKKNIKFSCDLCNKDYKSNKAVKNHRNVVHFGMRLFECDLCDKTYTDNTPLRIHKETVHKEEDATYACSECDKTFMSEPLLKNHSARFHSKHNIKKKCQYCEKLFHKYSLKMEPTNVINVTRHVQLNVCWRINS